MATEQTAFGIQVKFTATGIVNLLEVTPPDIKVDSKETTHHGLADRWRTFRQVMCEVGEGEMKIQLTSAQFAALFAKIDAGAAQESWSIIFPFAAPITFACSGFLSELKVEQAPVDGILEASVKFKCSGKPTLT